MRSLYILRHGKAEAHAASGDDHARDLTARGRKAAETMGRFLRRVDELPQLVLVSSAVRARRTVEIAADAGEWSCPIEVEPALYAASPRRVMQVVQGHDSDAERVLVAGHEPWCSQLVAEATGAGPPRFPTAALARVDFALEAWHELAPGRGLLHWLVPPKLAQRCGG